jgi:NADH dehydrogenase
LFLTGAGGFVGRRVLEALDPARYASLRFLVRRPLALPARLHEAPHAELVEGDLLAPDTYRAHLDADTTVLHLAALTGNATRREHMEGNLDATERLLDACRDAGVPRFLFVSTVAVAFELRAGYHYADAKEAAERAVSESGIPYLIARPTIVLGPGSPIWDALAGFAAKPVTPLPGSGRAEIQPVWADDLAAVLLDLAGGTFDGTVVDVGGPERLTFDEFMRRASRRLRGKPGPILHLPAGPIVLCLRMLEALLPFCPPVTAGQFASFRNDGVARPDPRTEPHLARMRGVDTMLDELTAGAHGG